MTDKNNKRLEKDSDYKDQEKFDGISLSDIEAYIRAASSTNIITTNYGKMVGLHLDTLKKVKTDNWDDFQREMVNTWKLKQTGLYKAMK